jgi:hypothetical protein
VAAKGKGVKSVPLPEWVVHIEANAPEEADPPRALADLLNEYSATVVMEERSLSVTLTFKSGTARGASLLASEVVEKAVIQAGLPSWPITKIEVGPIEPTIVSGA